MTYVNETPAPQIEITQPPSLPSPRPPTKKKKRNRRVIKGETQKFRQARKINNLGINRELVPDLIECSFNCQVRTSQEERQQIWDEFRAITDMNLRLQYLANLIDIHTPSRSKVPKENCTKIRSLTNKYYLRFNEYLDNSRYQVCKVCFLTVFNVTPTKIRTIVSKKLVEGEEIVYNRGKKVRNTNNNDTSSPQMSSEDNVIIKIEPYWSDIPNTSQIIEEVVENVKIKRNRLSKKGQTGEFRNARKIKNLGIDRELVPDLPVCSLNCRNRTSVKERQAIWDDFRQIVDMNTRLKYLANLIQFKPPSHTKVVKEEQQKERKRTCIPIFHLKWIRNVRNLPNRLCKGCFMIVFNLTNSKVRTIVEKKFRNVELAYKRGQKGKSGTS